MSHTSLTVVTRLGVVAGLTLGGLVALPAASASASWVAVPTPVTNTTWLVEAPDVSGTKMVYSDYRNQHDVGDPDDPDTLFDIRLRDLKSGTDKLLTPKHDAYGNAVISGNRVVWMSSTGTKWKLNYLNLSSGHRKVLPVVSGEYRLDGTRLCYTGSDRRIHVYDLSTNKAKTVSPKGESAGVCDISGKRVVWETSAGAPNFAIKAYDLATKKLTTVRGGTADLGLPRIDGKNIVWDDDRTGSNVDVYLYNLGTKVETRITSEAHNQSFPVISGGRIVFQDGSTSTEQLYMYDIATGTQSQLTDGTADAWAAAISGNRIVFEQESGADPIRLYQTTITPPVVKISAPKSVKKGATVTVSGSVSADSMGILGATVRLDYSTNGTTWKSAGTAMASMFGTFQLTGPSISKATWFRVHYLGSSSFLAADSAKVKVKIG